MFDRKSFARKNAVSSTVTVKVGAFGFKMDGQCDDTADAMTALAKKQTDNIKVAEKVQVLLPDGETAKKTNTHVLTPSNLATFISGEEAPKGKK